MHKRYFYKLDTFNSMELIKNVNNLRVEIKTRFWTSAILFFRKIDFNTHYILYID